MTKNKDFVVPSRKQPFWKFVKKIFSIFLRKPKIINLAGEINNQALYLSNHQAKTGPLYLDMYYPKFHCMWGAHEMLGTYKERFKYLRDVFYMQKRGFSKAKANSKSWFEAIFNKYLYKGMHVIGTYQDARLKETFKKSLKVLNNDIGIIIFPEDSSNGYFDVLTKFNQGFISLALMFYRKHGVDLPIYPNYVNTKKKVIIIGKPLFVNELLSQGKSFEEVAEIFKNAVNDLYYNYIENNQYKKY